MISTSLMVKSQSGNKDVQFLSPQDGFLNKNSSKTGALHPQDLFLTIHLHKFLNTYNFGYVMYFSTTSWLCRQVREDKPVSSGTVSSVGENNSLWCGFWAL